MHSLISILSSFADWLWGPPLLILLVGGGIFLTLRLGFFQIRYFPYIMNQTFGKMFNQVKEPFHLSKQQLQHLLHQSVQQI